MPERANSRPHEGVKARFQLPKPALPARSEAARPALLITTVPTNMSCSSRRRALKNPTSRMTGDKTLMLIQ